MYRNYIIVKKEDIVTSGVTGESFGKHRYLVYVSPEERNWKIRMNAEFYEDDDGNYICCSSYERGICRTVEEFRSMTTEEIENEAYGAYMDGAR